MFDWRPQKFNRRRQRGYNYSQVCFDASPYLHSDQEIYFGNATMIYRRCQLSLLPLLASLLFVSVLSAQQQQEKEQKPAVEKKIFSGPQAGEKLPPLTAQAVFGDRQGKDLDLVKAAGEKPILIVFVHQLTRPSVALNRVLINFTVQREEDVYGATIFLTGDVTAMQARLVGAKGALVTKRPVTISMDGLEGPGAYGLNRNVTMTVIFAKGGKVVSNFAIVDPSVQADTPRILGTVLGAIGGKMPTLAQLGASRYRGNTDNPQQINLRPILAPVINKQATPEQVEEAARKAEEFFAKNPAARNQIGRVARRIIDGGMLGNYGTTRAQEYLQKWAKQYPEAKKPESRPKRPPQPDSKPPR